ncbi:hypothetical protein [Corynebacterium uterequi]|uniref:Uncharacterized protein n=1 Tax=Corynebacterium uterequi TaxID=1072256 RepID=A0A0G3HK95_9CORY|nr:hypothetical protein [Corynebacterium uterequi]AKK11572.1 hypothetical protein CUTER_07935 [Corynebacterium uterequi]
MALMPLGMLAVGVVLDYGSAALAFGFLGGVAVVATGIMASPTLRRIPRLAKVTLAG